MEAGGVSGDSGNGDTVRGSRDTRAFNATGKEGSVRGQVEKAKDFGQIQSEDEIRCQRGSEPRRFEGRHHYLSESGRKHQWLQAHGAGYS